ncbi:putative nuclear RNA export factor SDE5 isoform X1 [Chenopodium quinoa]|uniref:putative nuclear RNA export factor SDE5 isoform X1 n=1 Tax=Chenopodium quinoa TaxID=63459 RepID=UPI000B78D3A1|nr:putative nuclear RNA export factor SDE5 isoform X1 [Chenopodium quinoa]XP_021726104.1 putative nuclear RNA export factor SDE5 isoform X1 [Chenopodium quinoa]
MEAASSCNSSSRDCNRDMELLLEAFGSTFSLETLASAYSQANSNVDLVGVILYELQGTTAATHKSKDGINATSLSSLDLCAEGTSKYLCIDEGNGKGAANNYVTGNSGGECLKSIMATNESTKFQSSEVHSNESIRIQSSEVHSNESFSASCNNAGKDDSLHADIEDFLFKMLGDGFQLDTQMIHQVLGLCGYDLEKSMETLVDLSASTLEKSDDVVSGCAEKEMYVYLKNGPNSNKLQSGSSLSNDGLVKENNKESRRKNNANYDLQKEILGSLFSAPERVEKLPRKTSVRSSRTYGRTAVEPVIETSIEQTFVALKPLADYNEVIDKYDEDSFPALRQAVKEYWTIMKEYCKAATAAYSKGDREKADKLMKECQFYNRKARDADEKSAKKVLESRPEDEVLLDISTLELKEAIKLLKRHLSNLSGIPTIRYLKVSVGDDGEENKKKRLKRLVLKLLENESIPCTEADNGKTIVIQIDEINPKTLSFAKK